MGGHNVFGYSCATSGLMTPDTNQNCCVRASTKEDDMDWNKLFAELYPKTEDFLLVEDIMPFNQASFAIARLDSDKFLETAQIIAEVKKEY